MSETWLNSESTATPKAVQRKALLHDDRPGGRFLRKTELQNHSTAGLKNSPFTPIGRVDAFEVVQVLMVVCDPFVRMVVWILFDPVVQGRLLGICGQALVLKEIFSPANVCLAMQVAHQSVNVERAPEAVTGSAEILLCFHLFQATNHVGPAQEFYLFWHNQLVGLEKGQMLELIHVPVEKDIFTKPKGNQNL